MKLFKIFILVLLLGLFALPVQEANGMPRGKRKNDKKNTLQIKDRDGDGVPDEEDLCPDIPGPAKSFGCPDSDGDGIPDFKDDCPDVPGLPEYNGCPDSDGDGIPDNLDACPHEAGPKENNGCPIRESDPPKAVVMSRLKSTSELTNLVTDQSAYNYNTAAKSTHYAEPEYYIVPEVIYRTEPEPESAYEEAKKAIDKIDKEKQDKRDAVKTAENTDKVLKIHNTDSLDLGEIKKLEIKLSNIQFDYGRSKLKNESLLHIEDLSDLLHKNPKWGLLIHAYANDADNNFRNLQLSENRGLNIKNLIVSNNIDKSRIAYKGYGNIKNNNLVIFEILK